jgi:predicted acylesterase/phospholipase RssA
LTKHPKTERRFTIGSTDANTGDFIIFDNDNISHIELATAAKASASIPGVFPFTDFKGHLLVDGSVAWDLNMGSAIKYCQDQGFEDANIIVDAVLTYSEKMASYSSKSKHTIENYLRHRDISSYYSDGNGVYQLMKEFPNVQFRYLVSPTTPIASGLDLLNFGNSNVIPMIKQGTSDAELSIKKGAGYYFKKTFEQFEPKQ